MPRSEIINKARMSRLARTDKPKDPPAPDKNNNAGQGSKDDGKTHLWGEDVDLKYCVILLGAGTGLGMAAWFTQLRSIGLLAAIAFVPGAWLLTAKAVKLSQVSIGEIFGDITGGYASFAQHQICKDWNVDAPSGTLSKIWNGLSDGLTWVEEHTVLKIIGLISGKDLSCPKKPK